MAEIETAEPVVVPIPGVKGQLRAPTLAEQITTTEEELVLRQFAELKRRGDGELRIAVRRDPRSGVIEVTYCGLSEKADLEALRRMYAQLRTKGHRF